MANATDLLKAGRQYVTQGFCQNTSARDANGNPVEAVSPEAIQWCMLGALERAYWQVLRKDRIMEIPEDAAILSDALDYMRKAAWSVVNGANVSDSVRAKILESYASPIIDVNDFLGLAATLQTYDQALVLAQGEQSAQGE
jgi:hypothetical protein